MTNPAPTSGPNPTSRPAAPGPPSTHQLALMIWLAVFPTLTVLNLALGDGSPRSPRSFARSCSPPSLCRSSSTDSCRTCTDSADAS